MKILVVDDSGGMRDLVRRAVTNSGSGDHEFIEAANGVEALKKVLTEKPDLVISDWYMPEMSGLALLRAIRANGSNVNFGIITADSSEEIQKTATDAGANFVIRKPFTADKFIEALGSLN
ncbi:MAG: response regulator [Myxococcota bacterium]|nr:response regulator [Myxococcota bacterium]